MMAGVKVLVVKQGKQLYQHENRRVELPEIGMVFRTPWLLHEKGCLLVGVAKGYPELLLLITILQF